MTDSRIKGDFTPFGLRVKIKDFRLILGNHKNFRRFLSTLTVTEKPQPGRPKTYARARRTAYSINGEYLYMPRIKAQFLEKYIQIQNHQFKSNYREIQPQNWEPAQKFYDYQLAASDYVCSEDNNLLSDNGIGIAYVQMGTGMGKSRFGMAVAARRKGPVFVIVPTKAIRMQWIEEFQIVFPMLRCASYDNPPKKSKKVTPDPENYDVVVGIINTIRSKDHGFFYGYSTVIIDEAHELHSPSNIKILWLIQEVPNVLGISATPDDRIDGLDKIVYHFLGKPIWAKEDIKNFDVTDVNFRGRVREIEYKGNPDYCETAISAAGTVSAIETIKNIIHDPARLRLVAAEVERLFYLHESEQKYEYGLGPRPAKDSSDKFPEGEVRTHGIFVFAEHREYLPALRDALLERFNPEDIDVPECVVLRGGATHGELNKAHNSRIVLTTYGYSRRGVSLVEMTSIILATPRRNGLRQILGRITRRGSDESIIRIVVDIKDVLTALKSQNTNRRKVYKEKKYPIYKVSCNHKDFEGEGKYYLTSSEKSISQSPLEDDSNEVMDINDF